MKPDAVENHPIWEDSDVEVWLQDVVEASNLFIPGEKKCFKRSCFSVIDDL